MISFTILKYWAENANSLNKLNITKSRKSKLYPEHYSCFLKLTVRVQSKCVQIYIILYELYISCVHTELYIRL